ncbi:MAG: type I restriction endonuclease subunit R, partial [Cyanobacteria bacterium J06639_1]
SDERRAACPRSKLTGYARPFLRSVRLNLDDGDEMLQGRIDVLVLLDRMWVVVLESKKTALSIWTALPQTLAYLMANSQPELPSFGMVANGDEILFVKLS